MRREEYLQGILGALGVGEDNGVPEPVWNHEEYLKAIYDAVKGVASTVSETASEVDDLDGRVTDLEENPVSPEAVQTAVDNYMDAHPEKTHLGFYRDSDGDLCESDDE